MMEREGYEQLDLTPLALDDEELAEIPALLEATKSGYRLAYEMEGTPPERIRYVPTRDIAPSWDELRDWCIGLARNFDTRPRDAGPPAESMRESVSLRMYPVRREDQSDEEPPVLILVDWTNKRIVGLA